MAKKKNTQEKSPNYFLAGLIILAVIVVVYFICTWNWPSHDVKDLIGTWSHDASDYVVDDGGGYQVGSMMYFTFEDGGVVKLSSSSTSDTSEGTYTVADKTLTFNFSGNEEAFEFVIKGDRLLLGEKGEEMEFTRTTDR